MIEIVRLACCPAEDAGGYYDEPANEPPVLACGPVLGIAPAEPPCPAKLRESAWHEAAHVLCTLALEGIVGRVSVGAPNPFAQCATPPPNAGVTALGGPIGGNLAVNLIRSEADASVLAYISRIRAGKGGFCDGCRAARAALAEAGHDADDSAALAAWRRAEALALAIVTSEPGRRFIRIAARELQSNGELPGSYFHNLADEVLPADFLSTLELEV